MSTTDMLLLDHDGEPTLYLGPTLLETLPPRVLEGLAKRRLVAVGQPCPCGARLVLPNRAARRSLRREDPRSVLTRVQVEHENDCEAICPELLRWAK